MMSLKNIPIEIRNSPFKMFIHSINNEQETLNDLYFYIKIYSLLKSLDIQEKFRLNYSFNYEKDILPCILKILKEKNVFYRKREDLKKNYYIKVKNNLIKFLNASNDNQSLIVSLDNKILKIEKELQQKISKEVLYKNIKEISFLIESYFIIYDEFKKTDYNYNSYHLKKITF